MNTPCITLFYDGFCPLCVHEISQLKTLDSTGKLSFVDIQKPDLMQNFPQIEFQEATRILLALTDDGRLLRGLDATHAVWTAVGKGVRTAWLRWPIIRPIADRAYLFFAANRYQISRLLTGKARCDNGVCGR